MKLKKVELISKEYSFLWLSQTLSSLGEYFFIYTANIWTIDILFPRNKNISIFISILVIIPNVIRIILGFLSGVFSDRHNPRKIMLITNLIRIIMFLLLFLVVTLYFSHFCIIFISLIFTITVAEICAQYFNPSRAILIQRYVPDNKRITAAQYSMMSVTGTALIAAYLGSTVYILLGPKMSIITVSITYLGSWVCIKRIPNIGNNRKGRSFQTAYWQDCQEGLMFLRKNLTLRFIILAVIACNLSLGINNVSLPLFSLKTIHLSIRQYGFICMVFSIANFFTALYGKKIIYRIGVYKVYILAMLALGVGYFSYCFIQSFFVAIFVVFFCGLSFPFIVMSQGIILWGEVPNEFMGRVSSIISFISSISSMVGTIISSGVIFIAKNSIRENQLYKYTIIFGSLLLIVGCIFLNVLISFKHKRESLLN